MTDREQETAHSNGATFILYWDSISWDDSAFVQMREGRVELIDKFFIREFLRETNVLFDTRVKTRITNIFDIQLTHQKYPTLR